MRIAWFPTTASVELLSSPPTRMTLNPRDASRCAWATAFVTKTAEVARMKSIICAVVVPASRKTKSSGSMRDAAYSAIFRLASQFSSFFCATVYSCAVTFWPASTAPPNTFSSLPSLSSAVISRRTVDSDVSRRSRTSVTVMLPFSFNSFKIISCLCCVNISFLPYILPRLFPE